MRRISAISPIADDAFSRSGRPASALPGPFAVTESRPVLLDCTHRLYVDQHHRPPRLAGTRAPDFTTVPGSPDARLSGEDDRPSRVAPESGSRARWSPDP